MITHNAAGSTDPTGTDPVTEIQRYLELLFPDPPPNAYLVVSWINGRKQWCNTWFRSTNVTLTVKYLGKKLQPFNAYVGLGLRHPDCTPAPGTRGESHDIYAIGGLWVELDHNQGVHAAQNLPTLAELLAFIEGLPFRFSLVVDSGGGVHAYVLFKELWILDTPAERERAALLLKRFQRTIKVRAAEHGWKVDSTADLARVLRPAGTLNHKFPTPKPVTFLHEEAIRYN